MKKFLYSLLAVLVICTCAYGSDIGFSEEEGEPVRLGIMPFSSKAYGVPDGMAAVISDFFSSMLYKAEGISLLERERLDDIGAELKLGISGLVNDKTAAQIGKIAGCQYMLLGSITNLSKGESGMALPSLGIPFGGFGVSKEKVKANIDVRVVDVETGGVVFADRADGEASRSDRAVSVYGIGFEESEFDNIENIAIANAVAKLAPSIQKALTGRDTLSASLNPSPKSAKRPSRTPSRTTRKTSRPKTQTPPATELQEDEEPSVPNVSTASHEYENKSTDPAKVIKTYGLSSGETNSLRIRHINLAKMGNTKRAYNEYVKLAEEHENDYLAAYKAGEIARRLRNKDDARSWYEKALEINPDYEPAQQALAKL